MKEENARIVWIDCARALCILEIVCISHMGYYTNVDFTNAIFVKITEGVLALFTFLSGFCLNSYTFDTMEATERFYKKRFVRTYPLFLIAAILIFLYPK